MSAISVLIGKVLRKISDNKKQSENNNKKGNILDPEINNIVKEYIEATSKECYAMEVVEGKPSPIDSHMGGIPYMPIKAKWPLTKDGSEMPFLIQINFENVDLNNFPNKGLLQVFYSWETKEQEVRFYEEIEKDYQDESCLPEWHFQEGYTCGTPIKINLKKFKEVNPNFLHSNKFNEIFKKYYNEDYDFTKYNKYKEKIDLIDKELDKYITRGNVGGWAQSAQGYFDNMNDLLTENGNEIFFFIDSMLKNFIAFGDGGYFWGEINPKDLKNKNLEKMIIKTDSY